MNAPVYNRPAMATEYADSELTADIKNAFDKELTSSDAALEEALARLSAVVQREISKRRIYCLTPIPHSILMWSHYADNHRGVCLEFDTANRLFSLAMKV